MGELARESYPERRRRLFGTGGRYSFTQPICADCYDRRYPGREPARVIDAELEACCDCARSANEGIYIRVDPATVAHPTRLRDE